MAALLEKFRSFNRPKQRAVAKGFPVHPILGIEHDFKWVGFPVLLLARAVEDIDDIGAGAAVWM